MDEERKSQEIMPHLPEEIIVAEILTRLPVNSLLRFKSVSKGWNSKISSLQFSESHLMRSTYNPLGVSPYKLLVSSTVDMYMLRLGGDDDLGLDGLVRIENLVPENLQHFFLGSSRGLVCFRSCNSECIIEDFYVYNPSTRWCQRAGCPLELRGEMMRAAFGFGYVSSLDDYKIVVLQFPSDGPLVFMYVYSLKSDRWNKHKVVCDARYPMVMETGQLVYDALHWLIFRGGMPQDMQCILCFNLVNETLDLVPLPDKEFTFGLFESGGCLRTWRKVDKTVLVSILKEYGVWKSWTKWSELDGMLGLIDQSRRFVSFRDIGGTCFALTTIGDHKVELADLEGNLVKYIGDFECFDMICYIESLISPFVSRRLMEGSNGAEEVKRLQSLCIG
ncbi:hypothetical protein Droror1_Dr00002605 [Drosera rotundifolia]